MQRPPWRFYAGGFFKDCVPQHSLRVVLFSYFFKRSGTSELVPDIFKDVFFIRTVPPSILSGGFFKNKIMIAINEKVLMAIKLAAAGAGKGTIKSKLLKNERQCKSGISPRYKRQR